MTNSFETGGSERQFAALAQSLDHESFRVHLGCIMRKGAFQDSFGDVPIFGLGGSLYRWTSIQTRLRLARHLRSHDIAVSHAFDFYTNLTLIPAAKLARVPVIIGSQRQLGDLLTKSQFRVQQAAFHCCDAVVCNSQAAADLLMARGLPRSKVVIIGNGLPDSAFAETAPALPRLLGEMRVGMIARMNARSKNHSLFLQAAAQLRSRFRATKFFLVGDGPLRPELEREAERLGLGDSAIFLGDRRDIPAILASLDVSVLPSSSESLSNVILESMAAGLPVVACWAGGNSELLTQERGVLVKSCEPELLADATGRLLQDAQLRAELGRAAKQFVHANFTVERMVRRHQELYMELLEKKNWESRVRARSLPQKLKITIIAASLRYVGGQSAQADLLARKWKGDPDVTARIIAIDPVLPKALRWAERIPGLRTMVRQPLYLWGLWRGLKHADVAHIFSASYWSFLIAPVPAWIMARLLGKKALLHYHSGEARDHLQRFRSARAVLSRVDRLVVPSQYLVDVFREFGLKADSVPNVADLSQFSFRLRNPLRPHLVCTRGFHPYYGVDIVVQAFARLKQVFPEARLDLVGEGPSEQQVRAVVKDLQVRDANFLGTVSREQIHLCYDRADIFVNASRLDNVPVSILEAFASGTPVVSTAPECMPYLVDHERTGLLSPVDDPQALADNMVRLLRDGELASRLSLNAYQEAKCYGWERVRKDWLGVYRSLLNSQ
ncbi:MAG TPA: glycosyltransferase [Terriglobales bacterium]